MVGLTYAVGSDARFSLSTCSRCLASRTYIDSIVPSASVVRSRYRIAPGNFRCTPVTSNMRPSASLNVTPIRSRSLNTTVNLLFKRSQELNDIGCKTTPRSLGRRATRALSTQRETSTLVNGAVVFVVRFRHIGRGSHQAEWVNGNGGGFADGWFD